MWRLREVPARLATRHLRSRLAAARERGRAGDLTPDSVAALGALVAELSPAQAAEVFAAWPATAKEPGDPTDLRLLRRLVERLPIEDALAALGGTRGLRDDKPWFWSPPGGGGDGEHGGADEAFDAAADGADFFSEAWLHTGGYAGGLAALAGYLAFRPHLDRATHNPDDAVIEALRRAAAGRQRLDLKAVRRLVAPTLVDADKRIHLAGASLRLAEAESAWILLHELLVRRAYDFDAAGAAAPRVIDGGAHVGLGVYAVKRRHPDARITCFEPEPDNLALLEENIRHNGWTGVEALPYALAAKEGEVVFHRVRGESMAGSTSRRMGRKSGATVRVQARRLGPYLREPVDFLKVDIEGPEAEVLADAAGPEGRGLDGVRNVFCEYHHGRGLDPHRLPALLATLTDAGFTLQVNKSFMAEAAAAVAPLLNAEGAYALDVHGARREPA